MVVVPPFINASSPVQRPLPDKAIFWPTIIGNEFLESADATRFPAIQAIKTRKAAARPEPLAVFAKAAREAQDRVLVLDDYLFKLEESREDAARVREILQERVREILAWFPADFAGNDVRLLTGAIGDDQVEVDVMKQFTERADSINSARVYSKGLQISVQFTLGKDFPYIHDRFAIIDSELWHFGATVGGFHAKVNAATRGWSADDHQAYDFFDLAWRGDSDLGRTHDKRGRKR